ncbi:MAG: alpha-mannosidase [Anaerolineaceae bacterium]|nr:alpha-mannosidase [Anaerolineaceae bacterium]
MALTIEWQHRIERWQKVLWSLCYRPLGSIPMNGFTTREQLTAEQASAGSFQPMPVGTPWGAKWEYGWFKGSLTLPESAAGKRIVMRLAPGGESLVWINGSVAGSIGWAHKEITLSTSAVPGTTYDLLIESYGGHGHITVGDGPYPYGVESVPEPGPTQTEVKDSTYGIWLEDVYQAAVDLTTLYELRGRLDPLSLRVAEIDEALIDTTLLIDPELPEEELLETMRAGRARMQTVLEVKNGPTMPTMFAFGHAHIDVAWLWPLQETERKMARTAINQLALFDEYPEFKFLQSQPHLYWMLEQKYPELYARYKAAVKAGKVIADGAMWVEADTNVSGGEALIRQVMYGRQYFQKEFGIDSRVLWLPDVFGYSGAMPQILKGCGVIGFSTQKITWAYNGGDPFPYNTFWWEGIDGSAIPAHIFFDYNSQLRPNAVMDRWNSRMQKNNVKGMILAFGWGDGGGGPTRDHLEFFHRVEDLEGLPRVKMSTPAEFFTDLLEQDLVKERYVGELYFQAHRGTYTSQAKTKRGNRKSEFALREAELWGSAARALKGFEFTPDTLTLTWRKVLLNQFHDILPGSSIHRVYEEAEALHAEAIVEADRLTQSAQNTFTNPSADCTVFNSLSWERCALIETAAGLAEIKVPACGWNTLPAAKPGDEMLVSGESYAAAHKNQDGTITLENELIRARFDTRGELVSLWDKEIERESMAGAGNRLCLYKDVPTMWDAWDLDSMAEMQPVKTDEAVSLDVLNAGPLVARVSLQRKLHKSSVNQVIILRRGSRRIDFETTLDWQESHKLLKVAFPVNIFATEAIHEIQFGHLRRPNHTSRPFDADRFEVSAHKWSALAEENRGVAVLNDCKYGLSVKGNSINLTLLKSGMAPDMTADKGTQNVTYAIYAWNGSLAQSGVVREAYDLNVPVTVVPGSSGQGSLFSLDNDNVIIETVKPAEDGSADVIVRLYETKRSATRCTLSTSLPVKAASETNLVEEETGKLDVSEGKIALDFRPFEIKTVRLSL